MNFVVLCCGSKLTMFVENEERRVKGYEKASFPPSALFN
jgi:hypothetical protein